MIKNTMKKIIFLLLLNLQTSLLHCHFSHIPSKEILLALSKLQHIKIPPFLYKEAAQTTKNFYNIFKISSDKAHNLLQEELKEIYCHLETSEKDQVPLYIYKTPNNYPILGQTTSFTTIHGIFIHQQKKEHYPISLLRCTLGQAAVHVHNKDCILEYAINKAIEEEQHHKEPIITKLISEAIETNRIPLTTLFFAHKNLAILRAQFYGYQATQCSECVLEELQNTHNTFKKNNINQKQIEMIQKNLKLKGLLCRHHAANQNVDFTIP